MRDMSLPEESTGLVAGRLEGMSVPDLMWLLCRRRATGVLHLVRSTVAKKVYFQDGRIIFAVSSDPNERLGEMLLRDGLIGLEELEAAVASLHLGKRLGTLLVEMGHLRPEDLVRGVVSQVRDIVLELFTWEEGAYRLDEGPLPTQEVITLGMKTGEILLLGIRRTRSFARIRRSVGGPRQRFSLSPRSAEVVEGLELNDAERLLLQRLQRGSASIEALCREIYASNFEIHQALWALKVLGAVEEGDSPADIPGAEASLEGRLGLEGVIEVFVRLCRAGETGVLHVSRGSLERTFHVRGGRCVFATSNNIDDGLVAHLLRRGVISIHDREETAKRLLSNKRVGTILLEMGVIDEQDLREMVREQLSEIVYDTFRWEEGEYAFVPGELPTIEEIVLEMSLEDLIAHGVRRVTNWPRVRVGCADSPDAVLGLTSEYLGVLDRMTVGAEEWEVVSCLGEPRSILEICRRTSLGDFRVCQIVWALRLLGAVREIPASERPAAEPADRPVTVAPPEPGGEPEILGAFDGPLPIESSVQAIPVSSEDAPPSDVHAPPAEVCAGPGAIQVAPPEEAPSEVVSDVWKLTEEAFPAPPSDDARPADAGENANAVPPLDSPADATLIVSRAEVEAALGLSAPFQEGAQFELAAPGSGTDEPFAEAAAMDGAGGREFEIGEPVPEAPEPEAMPTGEPEPSFELAAAAGARLVEPAQAESAPAEVPEAEQTGEIPAEEIARAIGAAPADAVPAAAAAKAPEEAKSPVPTAAEPVADTNESAIADLDKAIGRFNQLHRVLYRAIRAEVGAGTANFIQACRFGLTNGQSELFAGARLLPDGTWDPEGLKKSIRDRSESEPWSGLERLLDREFEMLKPQIGEARTRALHEQISELRRSS